MTESWSMLQPKTIEMSHQQNMKKRDRELLQKSRKE